MNDLSLSLQSKNIKVLNCYEKLKVFRDKFYLWCQQMKRGNLTNFSLLEEIVDDNEFSTLIPGVCGEIVACLEVLIMAFDRYFDVGKLKSEKWIIDPFSFNFDKIPYDGKLKDLIELLSNHALKMQLENKTLEEYWCSAMVTFPRLCETTLAYVN